MGSAEDMWNISTQPAVKQYTETFAFLFVHSLHDLLHFAQNRGVISVAPVFESVATGCF